MTSLTHSLPTPQVVEPDGDLTKAARRFRSSLAGRNQVVIVTTTKPTTDTMLCAAAIELHLNDLDSRIGIVRIQDDTTSWFDKKYENSVVVLIHAMVTDELLFLLSATCKPMIIDARRATLRLVQDHNANYNLNSDSMVEYGMPTKRFSAASIGWVVSNRYVGNSYSTIALPLALTLWNDYNGHAEDTLPSALAVALHEYLEYTYNGSLEQSQELLVANEVTLASISEGYETLRHAKHLLSVRIARRQMSAFRMPGYDISLVRMNIPQEMMPVVGNAIRTEGKYLVTFEVLGEYVVGRVYYGCNWMGRVAINPEVERLRINLQAEAEEYGFSFAILNRSAKLFKSTRDSFAKALLQFPTPTGA